MKTRQKHKIPSPPVKLFRAGKAFWSRVLTEFEVEEHHHDLLGAACQQLDRAAEAAAKVATEGITVTDRFKQLKTHPAVEIERNAHLAFCRLQRELGLDIEPPEVRGPSRPGTRG